MPFKIFLTWRKLPWVFWTLQIPKTKQRHVHLIFHFLCVFPFFSYPLSYFSSIFSASTLPLSSNKLHWPLSILNKFISNKFVLLLWHPLIENLVGQRPVEDKDDSGFDLVFEVDLLFLSDSLFSLGKSPFRTQSRHMTMTPAKDAHISQTRSDRESFAVIHMERKIKRHFLLWLLN